jgi:hypothetical protein
MNGLEIRQILAFVSDDRPEFMAKAPQLMVGAGLKGSFWFAC